MVGFSLITHYNNPVKYEQNKICSKLTQAHLVNGGVRNWNHEF